MFKSCAALRLSAALLATIAASATGATAPPAPTRSSLCAGPLQAGAVVRCALSQSPEVRLARQELAVLAGQPRVSLQSLA